MQRVCSVLVLDDEEIILNSLVRLLSLKGYTVRGFTGFDGAWAYFKANAASIDVVIVDLSMPVINGLESFKRFNAHRPGLPVIISSGFSHSAQMDELAKAGVKYFLPKPYKLEEAITLITCAVSKSI